LVAFLLSRSVPCGVDGYLGDHAAADLDAAHVHAAYR
jgi:hypothetical protein